MEKILRSEKMAEIIFLPVRHHSPACSGHVRNMIEKLHPDIVLVEGPENANEHLKVVVHPDTKAPFAIYYSFFDKGGKISEEKEYYKCYYPFLDYSPELVALRTADACASRGEFIDLSYGEILLACSKGKGLRKEAEKNNYNDDYYLSQNEYIKHLCENAGLRSFDEFWEKYFEINNDFQEDEGWFDNLMVYCNYARENSTTEELLAEGCLAREEHMAQRIHHYATEVFAGGTIVVVTGGFHTKALKQRVEKLGTEEKTKQQKQNEKLRKQAETGEAGVYLMPYSMEAADALNGYASGMPYPGYYQRIWEELFTEEADKAWEKVALELLVKVGKEARKKEGNPSTYDEICAYQMLEGLAALRGKLHSGAYELIDAVLGSYIKGEYTPASARPMSLLKKYMTGQAVGELWEGADIPPILKDFRKMCKSFGIKLAAGTECESVLNIFSSPKHRKMSMFYHRLEFCGVQFAKRSKGPNLRAGKDRNLIREIWQYRYQVRVDAELIDASAHGATVEEAALALVKKELAGELNAAGAADIMIRVFEMGLTDQLSDLYGRVSRLMQSDTDFYSLASAVKALLMLKELAPLYDSDLYFDEMIRSGVRKLILLLPSMTSIKDDSLDECMEATKMLYQLTGRAELELMSQREILLQVLKKMTENVHIHAGFNGCIYGILYGSGAETALGTQNACKGYLNGTREQLLQTAQFFHGLFFSARDLVFSNHEFLEMLDEFLREVEPEEFMELLPELRMAFAYFAPREIDKLAKKVGDIHNVNSDEVLHRLEILPEWSEYGRELDAYVLGQMEN